MIRNKHSGTRVVVTILMAVTLSFAAINKTYLSLQGYSGTINTPNAMILPEGRMSFLYSNQTPPHFKNRFSDVSFKSFALTIGVFSCVEVTGRFLNSSSFPLRGPRDLSADIKGGYSFTVFNPWLPSIACGMQDVSGGATKLSTKYIVLSEDIRNLRLSIGYGTGPSRMKDLFFGAEFFVTPFLHLLFDNDGDQAGIALRLATTHDRAQYPLAMSFLIKNVYREKTPVFTFAASVSYDLKKRESPVSAVPPGETGKHAADSIGVSVKEPLVIVPEGLVQQLTECGLENILVTTREQKVVICYENNRFGHNEMDALGIVLGVAATMVDLSYDTLQVTVLRSGVPLIAVVVGKNNYEQFLRTGDATCLHLNVANPVISIKPVQLTSKVNGTTGKIRCEVSPRLHYFLGTEVGALDYQLSMNGDIFISLWPGGTLAARAVIPIGNTNNLERGKAFFSYKENTHLNSASLFQFVHFGHGLTTLLSTGLYNKNCFAVINDARFTDESGFLRIGIEGGYFTTNSSYRTTILSYAGFQLPKDLFLKITGGVFLEQDTGVNISITRRFTTVDLTIFGKYTKNVFNTFDKFVGAQIIIPLSLRKGMQPRVVSISGKNNWQTSLSTRLANKGSPNNISTACGVIPGRLLSLDFDYYNRNRLNRGYILQNVDLLRDSWIRNR